MQRRTALLATCGSFVGLALGLGCGASRCGASGLGPVPAVAMRLPKESRFIMGLDVRRFVAGEFYSRFAGPTSPVRPESFRELAQKAGVDPDHDLDQVLFAGGLGAQGRRGVLLALGRFDGERLQGTLRERHAGVVTREIGEHQLHIIAPPPRSTAVALLSPGVLALGPQDNIEQLLGDTGPGLSANEQLTELLKTVKGTPTFWLVGDGSALETAGRSAPGTGGGMPLGLPPIESVVVTSEVDPEVDFVAKARAANAEGARVISEMLNGFLALAALQAHQKPELKVLPTAVHVEQKGTSVTLSGTLSHDVVAALLPRPKAPSEPETTAPAPQ